VTMKLPTGPIANAAAALVLSSALIATPPAIAAPRTIGEMQTSGLVFKDTLRVEAFEDPKVAGVQLYLSDFQRPVTDDRPRVIDMSANSLPAAVGALLAAGVGYFAISSMTSSTPALAREPTKKLVRRHSSGDHAFLPNQANKDAIKASKENFGVPKDLVHDREGDRLPTTRGY